MINIVFAAIIARFKSSAGDNLRSLVTDMIITGSSRPLALPFMSFGMPPSATEFTFDALHDIVEIQYDIWDDEPSPERAGVIEVEFNSVYDDHLLATTGGFVTYRVDRTFTQLLRDPDKGWNINMGYEYRMAC